MCVCKGESGCYLVFCKARRKQSHCGGILQLTKHACAAGEWHCGAQMKFGIDQEIVDLEQEVMNTQWSAASVFGDAPKSGVMSTEKAAQQRRDWRPVARGDIHVEVKRTRHLPGKMR